MARLSHVETSKAHQRVAHSSRPLRVLSAVMLAGLVVAGCQGDEYGYGPKAERPVSSQIKQSMKAMDMSATSPIMVRIFKEENELEVWKQKRNGKYALLETFEICKWSGKVGPKFKEGDRQAPEGYYEITPGLMNPRSNYHLAFNLGYPNQYDRSHGRTGSHLMVHGACSSRGCYAMTDQQVQDIYALARDSFKGGQRSFQVQAYPFHLTPENLARHRDSEHMEFWQMLKVGYDHFELTNMPPKVDVCEKKYVFNAQTLKPNARFRASATCPEYQITPMLENAVLAKQTKDQAEFETIVAKLEAKEEREKRWAKTESSIASFVKGGQPAVDELAGDDAQTSEVALSRAKPETGSEIGYTKKQSAGSFLKKWLPFGTNKEEAKAASESVSAIDITPAEKP
ncbi:MAG: murein L,D-transpeptidase [Rhodobacteraceae bacterium]|nr:murein L,D-transpeptidase [Paracoccaceae bacterium]